nr:hypothetical protein [Tanacetum cinerariifolium]
PTCNGVSGSHGMQAPQKTVDGHHRSTHRRARSGLCLDERLYALACEEDVRCLATLVRSFKLIEVYIEHGVTALDSYLRAPQFRATLEEKPDELGSIIANRTKKILLLTWHESSETTKEPVCDSNWMKRHALLMLRGSGVNSSRLSHDESFRVDDLDLNLNDHSNLNVSQAETQSELPRLTLRYPLWKRLELQNLDAVLEDYVSSGEDVEQDTAYENDYDVQTSADTCTNDDDVDKDFLVDEENEIVEPDVNVLLFGISMDISFNNIGVTNLVSDDVLEGEDVDVINADGFYSDPGNDEEKITGREG